MKIYNITKKQAGKRLDVFLSEKFPGLSRSQIQKEIKAGGINVNSKTVKPSCILKTSDKIFRIFRGREKSGILKLKPSPDIKLNIIYEDQDIIVINKQPGLLTHPTPAENYNTLVNALIHHYPLLRNIGEDKMRPGIVHRLDKDTSGLMVIAKNNKTFDWLKEQFQSRMVTKKYYTLVHGKLKRRNGVIVSQIGRSKGKQITGKAIERLGLKSKESLTEYKVVKTYKNYSLVDVQPKTGRTHQIRVHLASIGHPVVGDKQYKFKRQITPSGLSRQFLHAYSLKFKIPEGKMFEFKAGLPKDLAEVIKGLE